MTEKPSRFRSPDLPLRFISALVMVGVAALGEFLGGPYFAGLIALISALVLVEWSGIVGPFEIKAGPKMAVAFVAITVFLAANQPGTSLLALAAVALGCLMASVIDRKMVWLAFGVVYATLPGIATVALRGNAAPGEFSYGFIAIAFVLAVVVATDTAAYFAGRTIGGPKLWPAVSPKKTWSGAIGGVVGAVVVGMAVAYASGLTNYLAIALLSIALAVVAELGDLGESALKRHFGVKDSGRIIPGHGGIMDRVDGHVVALTLAAVIGYVRSGGIDIAKGFLVW